jgi:hypothetical protein
MLTRDAQLAKLLSEHDIMCSRVVDLQSEVDRLRRKLLTLGSLVAEAQSREEDAIRIRNEKEAELQRLLSTRGYRLLNYIYYRFYENRYIGKALNASRYFVGSWMKRIRHR